jgi:hypothetical protein
VKNKAMETINVTLLPDVFGVDELHFVIQNVDDRKDVFRETTVRYEISEDAPFKKIHRETLKELRLNKINTKHMEIDYIVHVKDKGHTTWTFFLPNHYSKKMIDNIKNKFLEKIKPFIKSIKK